MPLEVGKVYTRDDGKRVTIIRHTLVSHKFVVDDGYQWYDKESGRAVDVERGGAFEQREGDPRNIRG